MQRLFALLIVAFAVVVWAPDAGTHALLRSSEPADGAVLAEAPEELVLIFSEIPDPALSQVQVLDAGGASVARGALEADPTDPRTLRIGLEPLEEGVFTVSWRAYSTVDGHVTGGAFAFGVGVDPVAVDTAVVPTPETPPVSGWEVAGRWGLYAGLVLLLGAAWVTAFAVPDPRAGLGRLLAAGWGASVAGLVLLAVAQEQSAGVGFGQFAGTSIGRALVGRAVALACAGLALLVALRLKPMRRAGIGVAGAAAAAAAFVHVGAGHAAATAVPLLQIGVQWLHVLGVGVWIGGLAAVLVGVRDVAGTERRRIVRRFSTVAGLALAVVAGTGIGRALTEVASWGQLATTGYGRLVLVKSGLLVVLAVLGALNRYRSVPEVERRLGRFRWVSGGELGVAGIVLLATALMASLSPARYLTAEASESIAVSGTDFASTVQFELEVAPGFPGANTFTARLTDPGDPGPVAADRVALRIAPEGGVGIRETTLELDRVDDGIWEARGSNLAVDGVWRIVALVERGARSVEVRLRLGTRCRTMPIEVPDQPTLHDADLGEGRTIQMYLDPGEPGWNEAHFTFFDQRGEELPITGELGISGLSEDAESLDFETRRFSSGHYIGGAELGSGRWRVEVEAVQADGERLTACFEERI